MFATFKNYKMKKIITAIFRGIGIAMLLIACSDNKDRSSKSEANKNTDQTTDNAKLIEERLRRFDSLDFQFYSNQQWDSLAISHDANIKVYYPDGTVTTGLFPQHIDMLKPLFTFAPDTKITNHPVKFGSGDWTAVIGEMEGTFSKPMPTADGKSIAPTGKPFKLAMCTVGHWKGGVMDEEYLFWDNQAYMKQIGLAP